MQEIYLNSYLTYHYRKVLVIKNLSIITHLLSIYPISHSLYNILLGDYKVHNTLLDHERNLVDNNSSHLDIMHVGGEQSIQETVYMNSN